MASKPAGPVAFEEPPVRPGREPRSAGEGCTDHNGPGASGRALVAERTLVTRGPPLNPFEVAHELGRAVGRARPSGQEQQTRPSPEVDYRGREIDKAFGGQVYRGKVAGCDTDKNDGSKCVMARHLRGRGPGRPHDQRAAERCPMTTKTTSEPKGWPGRAPGQRGATRPYTKQPTAPSRQRKRRGRHKHGEKTSAGKRLRRGLLLRRQAEVPAERMIGDRKTDQGESEIARSDDLMSRGAREHREGS